MTSRTCSSNLFRTNFKAANSAAFLLAMSALRVKRILRFQSVMSAFDPKRPLLAQNHNPSLLALFRKDNGDLFGENDRPDLGYKADTALESRGN
jgi:hypothetical protein